MGVGQRIRFELFCVRPGRLTCQQRDQEVQDCHEAGGRWHGRGNWFCQSQGSRSQHSGAQRCHRQAVPGLRCLSRERCCCCGRKRRGCWACCWWCHRSRGRPHPCPLHLRALHSHWCSRWQRCRPSCGHCCRRDSWCCRRWSCWLRHLCEEGRYWQVCRVLQIQGRGDDRLCQGLLHGRLRPCDGCSPLHQGEGLCFCRLHGGEGLGCQIEAGGPQWYRWDGDRRLKWLQLG
mmetsp:Transcript_79541/g.184617  ORF Transcript_79541/g.184617 Transcript_79541/m.184617 type:complete len:232 (-) Transcript_79541:54-749(-)